MSELTKEYFDEKFAGIDRKFTEQIELIDKLPASTKAGFDHVDEQLEEIKELLNIREQIEKHEEKFRKLEKALNIKL